MRMRPLLCVLLAIAGLTACSQSSADTCDVTANGELGAPVTVKVDCPEGAGTLTKAVSIKGKGNKVTQGQTVLMRATSFDSRTGEIVKAYDSGGLRLAAVSEEGMGDLSKQLVGVPEGSRLIIKRPGLIDGVPTASEIVVVDLLYTVAHGEVAAAPDPMPAGMPTVSVADGGGPAVVAPGGAIPEVAVVPLVVGNGAQVSKGQVLAVQYAVYDQSGQILNTTWNGGAPIDLDLKTSMQGLSEGLVDQKVGSRVVVLVPSASAQGTGDRVVIVDILGILEEAKTEKKPTGGSSSQASTGASGRS